MSGGVAIDVLAGVKVQTSRTLIADSIRLGSGAQVGDLETNRLVGNGVHGKVSGLVALPPLPVVSPVSPGPSNLQVGNGKTVSASPGRFASVSVASGGRLRLGAGVYDATDLDIASGGQIEALGAVQLHLANRLNVSAGAFIGAASGVTLSARDIRIEVSGINGTTGALGATPPAASFSSGSQIRALVLVPNGTLVLRTGLSAYGAFFTRDVDVETGASLTFQDGFVGCTVASCDDHNPCTVDACGSSGCTHTPASAGVSCGDGNLCNGSRVSHLLLGASTQKSLAEATHLLTTIKAREAKGEKQAFELTASQRSEDAATKATGGDLGFRSREELTSAWGASFAEAALALKTQSEIAPPMAGDRGVHLLKLLGRHEGYETSFEAAKSRIASRLGAERQGRAIENLVTELKKKADIRIDEKALGQIDPAHLAGSTPAPAIPR